MGIKETKENSNLNDKRPDSKDIVATSEYFGELIQGLNLTDDIFFSEVMRHADACEYLMGQIMDRPVKIKRLENEPQSFVQYAIRNIEGHSVCLDVYAEDTDGKICNIEMQKTNEDDMRRRLRMNGSLMDSRILEKGADYNKLPETYLLCITGYCPFKSKQVRHEIKSFVNGDPDQPYDNGVHIIYVNTVYSDNSELSKLMKYFKNSDPGVHDFGALSETVTKIKNPVKEEDNIMSEQFRKAIETVYTKTCADVREEDRAIGRQEGLQEGLQKGNLEKAITMIKNLLKINKLSFEEILNAAGITEETYEQYKDVY